MKTSISDSELLFPSTYPDYVYNFAYGSNMHPNVLTGRRKIKPIESIPGVLEGWQLTFDLRGIPAIEPCFGNIKPNPASEVHGVLHKMSSKDFKHLLTTEGGNGINANGYVPHRVNVHTYDGRNIEAYALVVNQASPAILSHHALPSNRYMSLLRKGAIHHNIHPLYIEYLQSLPSIERQKPVILLVIVESLLLITLLIPIWAPVTIYYMCKRQIVHARAFVFTLIMTNMWRIYRFFGASRVIQPYYSAPFPIGSTDFKTNTKGFYANVQSDEHSLENNQPDISSESISSSETSLGIRQRRNSANLD